MKTTLDLPDDLLIEAKAVAARRRITLKDLVAPALRRKNHAGNRSQPHRWRTLRDRPVWDFAPSEKGVSVDDDTVRKLSEEADGEKFARAMELRSGK